MTHRIADKNNDIIHKGDVLLNEITYRYPISFADTQYIRN